MLEGGGLAPGDMTYTYTDAELSQLLTSVLGDSHSGTLEGLGGLGGAAAPEGPPALQFLPHLPMPSSHTSSDQDPAVFVPSDLSGGAQPMDGDPPHQLSPTLGLSPLRVPAVGQPPPSSSGMVDLDNAGGRPLTYAMVPPGPTTQQQQRAPGRAAARGAPRAAQAVRGAAPPAVAAAAKQPHSIVEKQRRDRINFLIDELRELVPPQGTGSADVGAALAQEAAAAASGGDSRRPKHVVLSDTIRLIKDLQLQVAGTHASPPAIDDARVWEQQLTPEAFDLGPQATQQWQPGDAPPADAAWQAEQAAAQQAVSRHSSDGLHPELPLAPDGGVVSENGVVVECEEGRIRYVKITCPDRHGLLADVVRALRELPLEITTAAITTRRDNVVYDVFEVDVLEGSLTPGQLQCAVETALRAPADKKRKQEFAAQSPCQVLA